MSGKWDAFAVEAALFFLRFAMTVLFFEAPLPPYEGQCTSYETNQFTVTHGFRFPCRICLVMESVRVLENLAKFTDVCSIKNLVVAMTCLLSVDQQFRGTCPLAG
jgi:hypothetical protein